MPLFLAAFLVLPAVVGAAPRSETGVVQEVVDGDTLRVLVGTSTETVRLVGIDAPERSHPSVGNQFFGDQAAQYMSSLCLGKAVRMEKDSEDADRYDRLLRYVFLAPPDGRLLNLEMVRAGMARVYARYPFSRLEAFRSAERLARKEGRGLWKDGGGAEARWLAAGGARPVEVYPSGGREFVVASRGWARAGVARGELAKEIDWVLRTRAELSDEEFARRARTRGYSPLDAAAERASSPSPAAETSRAPAPAAVRWDEAHRHVGEVIVVEGTVVRTHRTASMLYLNFHQNWKRYLTVVVRAEDLGRFPKDPEAAYRGKRIRARGEVHLYQDRPEMSVRDPADIQIVP